MRFINICDTSGQVSGFTVHEDTVTVRGVLEHGAEFTMNEFRQLARNIDKALDPTDEHVKLNCRIGWDRGKYR
jgi:hypothetical protein